MTAENWIMISPALVLIAIAIALIPFVNHANAKFSKMANEKSQMASEKHKEQSRSEDFAVFASELPKLKVQTERLTVAIETLNRKIEGHDVDETGIEAVRRKFMKMKGSGKPSIDLADQLVTGIGADAFLEAYLAESRLHTPKYPTDSDWEVEQRQQNQDKDPTE